MPVMRGRGASVGPAARFGTSRLPKGASIAAVREPLATGGAPEASAEGEPTPILAAGGEYVVHPHVVRRIGHGNLKQGHRILDAFVLHA
jgi:hypothetical protein